MIRRLLIVASAVPLLLCVAMALLWVRSYWVAEQIVWRGADQGTLTVVRYNVIVNYGGGAIFRDGLTLQNPQDLDDVLKYERLTRTSAQTGIFQTHYSPDPSPKLNMGFNWISTRGSMQRQPIDFRMSATGYSRGFGSVSAAHTYQQLHFRLWMLTGCLAILSLPCFFLTVRYVIRWRATFKNPAACPTCGYDLTGNTSGACPECGAAIPQKSVTS